MASKEGRHVTTKAGRNHERERERERCVVQCLQQDCNGLFTAVLVSFRLVKQMAEEKER